MLWLATNPLHWLRDDLQGLAWQATHPYWAPLLACCARYTPHLYTLTQAPAYWLLDLRSVQPKFREFMDTKRHLIHFVATTNHKSRIMGAVLSRFRVIDLDPPSSTDWVLRALSILHSEGLNPTRQDVTLMLQNFDGSARDLIDLIEETVMASKAATP